MGKLLVFVCKTLNWGMDGVQLPKMMFCCCYTQNVFVCTWFWTLYDDSDISMELTVSHMFIAQTLTAKTLPLSSSHVLEWLNIITDA